MLSVHPENLICEMQYEVTRMWSAKLFRFPIALKTSLTRKSFARAFVTKGAKARADNSFCENIDIREKLETFEQGSDTH